MSNFAAYLTERTNKQIVEDERGFATYQFLENGHCYIEDIYVHPDFRKSGVAAGYADKISATAKAAGCRSLYGTVIPTANGSTDSLKVLLAYGFSLDSSANNLILFRKDF